MLSHALAISYVDVVNCIDMLKECQYWGYLQYSTWVLHWVALCPIHLGITELSTLVPHGMATWVHSMVLPIGISRVLYLVSTWVSLPGFHTARWGSPWVSLGLRVSSRYRCDWVASWARSALYRTRQYPQCSTVRYGTGTVVRLTGSSLYGPGALRGLYGAACQVLCMVRPARSREFYGALCVRALPVCTVMVREYA